MKYVKYNLNEVPNGSPQPLYDIHSSFSGGLYLLKDTLYGTYDDIADLSSLPSWATEITQTDWDTMKADILSNAKTNWKQNIEYFGNTRINTRYPEMSELAMDATYAQQAIPGLTYEATTPTKVEEVVTNANTMINMADTLIDLHNELADIDNKLIDNYIPIGTTEAYKPAIRNYYKTIMESMIKYRLRRLVKNWIISKQSVIDGYTMDDINNINDITFFDDCPDI